MHLERQAYGFSKDYQTKIASLIIRDPTFLLQYPDVINPTYFEYEHLVSIVRIVIDFAQKYSMIPTKESLQEEIVNYCNSYKIDAQTREKILSNIDDLFRIDISDAAAMRDKIISFGKKQAFRGAILECATIVNTDEDYERGRVIVDKALRVGENVNDVGTNFFADVETLPSLLAQDSVYSKIKRVRTMLPTLDKLSQGGPGRKQVWTVLGLPGGGKSSLLLNIAVAGLKSSLCVAHYTLGDLQEEDVSLRYAARLTGLDQDNIIQGCTEYYERITRYKHLGHNLFIKYYPSQVASVDTIRAHLSHLRSVMNFNVSIIIIDYADELAEMRSENMYFAAGQTYAKLNQLASDFDSIVWTASQVNRYSPKENEEDLIKKENVSDSWLKAAKADGIISINQTQNEYERGLGRIWVDKVRRGTSFRKFHVSVDLSKCTIREIQPEKIKRADPQTTSQPLVPPPPPVPSCYTSALPTFDLDRVKKMAEEFLKFITPDLYETVDPTGLVHPLDSRMIPLGTLCEVCGTPQFMCPGGATCMKDHGGAGSLNKGSKPKEGLYAANG